MKPFTLLAAAALLASPAPAQQIYEMPAAPVQSRWASPENPTGAKGRGGQANGGRKGAPTIAIRAGESAVLAEASGTSGTVRRIWMTFWDRSPRMLRSLRIDMYWDGAKTPAVSAPLGDFFGVGLGRTATFESALFSNPEGRSFVATVPMPFRTGMRIVLVNESAQDLPELFYDVDYTLGDRHGPNTLYFHAHWRRERPTTLQQDFELLPRISGRGRYLGANIGVQTDTLGRRRADGDFVADFHAAVEDASDGDAPEVIAGIKIRDEELQRGIERAHRRRDVPDDGVEERP
jgi:hypothetical protein